jgi:hypothetical protein
MDKPFQGVLTKWREDLHNEKKVIIGYADLHHVGFLRQRTMRTSPVVSLMKVNEDFTICETSRSFYLLVGPRKEK